MPVPICILDVYHRIGEVHAGHAIPSTSFLPRFAMFTSQCGGGLSLTSTKIPFREWDCLAGYPGTAAVVFVDSLMMTKSELPVNMQGGLWPYSILWSSRCVVVLINGSVGFWYIMRNVDIVPWETPISLEIRIYHCSRKPRQFCQWAAGQIRKITGCACAGNAANVFHATMG